MYWMKKIYIRSTFHTVKKVTYPESKLDKCENISSGISRIWKPENCSNKLFQLTKYLIGYFRIGQHNARWPKYLLNQCCYEESGTFNSWLTCSTAWPNNSITSPTGAFSRGGGGGGGKVETSILSVRDWLGILFQEVLRYQEMVLVLGHPSQFHSSRSHSATNTHQMVVNYITYRWVVYHLHISQKNYWFVLSSTSLSLDIGIICSINQQNGGNQAHIEIPQKKRLRDRLQWKYLLGRLLCQLLNRFHRYYLVLVSIAALV